MGNPRSVRDLLTAWHDVICGKRGQTAGGAAELRALEAEAEPYGIGNAISKVGGTVITRNGTVLVAVDLRIKARNDSDAREVHPLIAAAASFRATIDSLAGAMTDYDKRGDWDDAIRIGKSLLEITEDNKVGAREADAQGPISLGRLHKVAPELANKLHERLPGHDERTRQQVTRMAVANRGQE